MKNNQLEQLVMKILEDNKALNITNMDVHELTDITDRMIICSATSTRHAKSLADNLIEAARIQGIKPFGLEGEILGEWVLIDFTDLIVHIMLPEIRNFYSLEKLWAVTETKLKREAL